MCCFFVCRVVALFFLFLFLYLVRSRPALLVQCFPHVLFPLVLTWAVGAARPGVGPLTRFLVGGCCCCCFGVVVLPVVGGAVRSGCVFLVVTAVCFRVHFDVDIQCQPPIQVAVGGGRRWLPLASARAPSVWSGAVGGCRSQLVVPVVVGALAVGTVLGGYLN